MQHYLRNIVITSIEISSVCLVIEVFPGIGAATTGLAHMFGGRRAASLELQDAIDVLSIFGRRGVLLFPMLLHSAELTTKWGTRMVWSYDDQRRCFNT